MKSYGSVVRHARQSRGWTLEELAKRAHTNKGYISGIETRAVNPPASKMSTRLAKALGLDFRDLLRCAWAEKAPEPIRMELMNLLYPAERDVAE